MNIKDQMALIWFLICSSLAKHPPPTDVISEAGNQRSQHPLLLPSSLGGYSSDPPPTAAFAQNSLDADAVGTKYFDRILDDPCASVNDKDLPRNLTQCNETSSDDSQEVEGSMLGSETSVKLLGEDPLTMFSSNASFDTNTIQKMVEIVKKPKSGKPDDSKALKRVFLSNRSIVCNDGSQAGFYLRQSPLGSGAPWIVFLEGGWYCYDRQSCRNRWMKLRHLMTSSQWPETRDVGGMLSGNPAENPYWHSANRVLVPYCSSDSWAGASQPSARTDDSFHFMGKLIVNQVIKELIPLGLRNSSQLILAGSSAGGTGVMLNLDPVQHLLHTQLNLKHIQVRGVSDSGWFLDRTPYSPNTLPAVDAIKKGHILWHGSLPKRCVDLYREEPWRCYFGYRLYPTIKAPLFVFQWLFDEAQMTADSVGSPSTPQQWDYIHRMGDAVRASFAKVSAVFAPSCVSHSLLTTRHWLRVKVDDVSAAQALRCWEADTARRPHKNQPRNNGRGSPARHLIRSGRRRTITQSDRSQEDMLQNGGLNRERLYFDDTTGDIIKGNKASKTADYRQNQRSRDPHKNVHNSRREEKALRENRRTFDDRERRRRRGHKRRLRAKCHFIERNSRRHATNRMVRQSKDVLFDSSLEKTGRLQRSPIRKWKGKGKEACSHRHVERCSWPQCNRFCPLLLDPFTGEEVRFVDMLKSFGLEMDGVAEALGVDAHTLDSMDRATLLDLLTQQTN